MNSAKKILIFCAFQIIHILLATEVGAQTFKFSNCAFLPKKSQPTWTHNKLKDDGEIYVGVGFSERKENVEKQFGDAKHLAGNEIPASISIYIESEFFSFQIVDQKDSHYVMKNIIETKSNAGVYRFLKENEASDSWFNGKDCIFWVKFQIHKRKFNEIKRMIEIENRLDKVMELLNQGDSDKKVLLKDQKLIIMNDILRIFNSIDFTIIQGEKFIHNNKFESASARLEIWGDVNLPPPSKGGKIQLPEPSIIN